MNSFDTDTPLGRLIWAEIEELAAGGLLSDQTIEAISKYKVRNACEAFLYGDDPSAINLANVLDGVVNFPIGNSDLLTAYCDRVQSYPDDIEAWHLICRLAEATMMLLDTDQDEPNYDRRSKKHSAVVGDCHSYALMFFEQTPAVKKMAS